MNRFMIRLLSVFILSAVSVFATTPDQKNLPRALADFEKGRSIDAEPMSEAPPGPVQSLGEWETAEAAMTLWTNPSLVRALATRGKLKLFADSKRDQSWWENWLQQNGISDKGVSYFFIPTDSIWIRDYGPWGIIDSFAKFGWVHSTYNRPRPIDNQVAKHIAEKTNDPLYVTGLTHTGGNYYSDGLGNAFSSTLVFTENSGLSATTILRRMLDFLGIERYTTSRLAPGITIEHLDTFGKLVSPDTFVFSNFPVGTTYKADSEKMYELIKTLKSPYGTPYKIFSMRMTKKSGGDYRAYINSFISNSTLYFPTYGDSIDDEAKKVYEAALPGHEIVGVSAGGTAWGDSVHCRTRNIPLKHTLFIFPKATVMAERGSIDVTALVIPSEGAELSDSPRIHWFRNGVEQEAIVMESRGSRKFFGRIEGLAQGDKVSYYLKAGDTSGFIKTHPVQVPKQMIEVEIK